MWHISGNNLQMAEGDYGLELPVTIKGTTLSAADIMSSAARPQSKIRYMSKSATLGKRPLAFGKK